MSDERTAQMTAVGSSAGGTQPELGVQRRDLCERLVGSACVVRLGDVRRVPSDDRRDMVAMGVRRDPDRLAVGGVQIDLDGPAEFGYREIESSLAVAGQMNAMPADEAENPGASQCVGDTNFRV